MWKNIFSSYPFPFVDLAKGYSPIIVSGCGELHVPLNFIWRPSFSSTRFISTHLCLSFVVISKCLTPWETTTISMGATTSEPYTNPKGISHVDIFGVVLITHKTLSNFLVHFLFRASICFFNPLRIILFAAFTYTFVWSCFTEACRWSICNSSQNHLCSFPVHWGPFSLTKMLGIPYLTTILN